MFRVFAIFAMLSQLTACADLPRPFEGAERNDDILDTILVNPGVMIAPVIGVPAPLNTQLPDTIAEAAQALDVAAITRSAGRSASLLQGEAIIVDNGSDKELLFRWVLSSPDGLTIDQTEMRVPAFNATAEDPWLVFANSDLSPIVNQTAAYLYQWLYRPSALASRPEAPPPPPPLEIEGTYAIFVPPVTGAPGDGASSLTDAMRQLLDHEDLIIPIKLVSQPTQSTYVIAGAVKTSRLSDEIEEITIDWKLISPGGELLGTAGQQNQIAAGSLDGEWGDTALFAVEAAAEGVLNLLLQFPPLDPDPSGQVNLRGSVD